MKKQKSYFLKKILPFEKEKEILTCSLWHLKEKSNSLRILPTNVPQTYWVACRTPETEMDEFVHISHRGLNLLCWILTTHRYVILSYLIV